MTACRFTLTTILVNDLPFTIEGNSKISGPDCEPNAFSLPAPSTCIGSTALCRRLCYASSTESDIPSELRETSGNPDKRSPCHKRKKHGGVRQLPSQRCLVCPVDDHGVSANTHCGTCRRCLERPEVSR